MKKRVGRQFPVEKPFINIFWDTPCGDGLSVKELSRCCNSCSEDVLKARRKIGLGKIMLTIALFSKIILILLFVYD